MHCGHSSSSRIRSCVRLSISIQVRPQLRICITFVSNYLNTNYLFRNVSILGGLIMVLSDTLLRDSKSKNREVLSSLPSYSLSPRDKHKYLLLAGRVLLVFLFIGFVAGGKWTLTRVIMSIFGFVVCAMVVVGFKARYSAMLLILVLSICNLFLNNFWNANSDSVTRDFLRYGITIYYLGLWVNMLDFFQTLSIVGGFLLLVNIGPGNISMDEKKKVY